MFDNSVNLDASVLLLGMFYGNYSKEKLGQEFRDKIRCEALTSMGYNVKTLDNKHDRFDLVNRHCFASFTYRKFVSSMQLKWGKNITFDHIILDYFFSPDSWADERWNGFIQLRLPELAEKRILRTGCKIWLPNIPCVNVKLREFEEYVSKYYSIEYESNVMTNPLYAATEEIDHLLARIKPPMTNKNQIKHIYQYSQEPFIILTVHEKYTIIHIDDESELTTDGAKDFIEIWDE